jgi:hypothetical protein
VWASALNQPRFHAALKSAHRLRAHSFLEKIRG